MTWSLIGDYAEGTKITPTGFNGEGWATARVDVSERQRNVNLQIRARHVEASRAVTDKFVTVKELPSVYEKIEITTGPTIINRGANARFEAVVTGTGPYLEGVFWKLDVGTETTGTTITPISDTAMLLNVADLEDDDLITVIATAAGNPNLQDTMIVEVKGGAIISVKVDSDTWMKQHATDIGTIRVQKFREPLPTVNVSGVGEFSDEVVWTCDAPENVVNIVNGNIEFFGFFNPRDVKITATAVANDSMSDSFTFKLVATNITEVRQVRPFPSGLYQGDEFAVEYVYDWVAEGYDGGTEPVVVWDRDPTQPNPFIQSYFMVTERTDENTHFNMHTNVLHIGVNEMGPVEIQTQINNYAEMPGEHFDMRDTFEVFEMEANVVGVEIENKISEITYNEEHYYDVYVIYDNGKRVHNPIDMLEMEYPLEANPNTGTIKLVTGDIFDDDVTVTVKVKNTEFSDSNTVKIIHIPRSARIIDTMSPWGEREILSPGESHKYDYVILMSNGKMYEEKLPVTWTLYNASESTTVVDGLVTIGLDQAVPSMINLICQPVDAKLTGYSLFIEIVEKTDRPTGIKWSKTVPDSVEVNSNYDFNAEVEGVGDYNKEVAYKVEGMDNEYNTTIDESGGLHVHVDERAEQLKVTATAVGDENISISHDVFVTRPQLIVTVPEPYQSQGVPRGSTFVVWADLNYYTQQAVIYEWQLQRNGPISPDSTITPLPNAPGVPIIGLGAAIAPATSVGQTPSARAEVFIGGEQPGEMYITCKAYVREGGSMGALLDSATVPITVTLNN